MSFGQNFPNTPSLLSFGVSVFVCLSVMLYPDTKLRRLGLVVSNSTSIYPASQPDSNHSIHLPTIASFSLCLSHPRGTLHSHDRISMGTSNSPDDPLVLQNLLSRSLAKSHIILVFFSCCHSPHDFSFEISHIQYY